MGRFTDNVKDAGSSGSTATDGLNPTGALVEHKQVTNYLGVFGSGASLVLKGTVASSKTQTFTVPPGVTKLRVRVWGAGGGGGGGTVGILGHGGGGGGYAHGEYTVAPGQQFLVTAGKGGSPASSSSSLGQAGETSSFGALLSASGGGGGGSGVMNESPGIGGTGVGGTEISQTYPAWAEIVANSSGANGAPLSSTLSYGGDGGACGTAAGNGIDRIAASVTISCFTNLDTERFASESINECNGGLGARTSTQAQDGDIGGGGGGGKSTTAAGYGGVGQVVIEW